MTTPASPSISAELSSLLALLSREEPTLRLVRTGNTVWDQSMTILDSIRTDRVLWDARLDSIRSIFAKYSLHDLLKAIKSKGGGADEYSDTRSDGVNIYGCYFISNNRCPFPSMGSDVGTEGPCRGPEQVKYREKANTLSYDFWLSLIALERYGLIPPCAYDDPQLYFMTHTQNLGGVLYTQSRVSGYSGVLYTPSRASACHNGFSIDYPPCGAVRNITRGSHGAWALTLTGDIYTRDMRDDTSPWRLAVTYAGASDSVRAVVTGTYGKNVAVLFGKGDVKAFTASGRLTHIIPWDKTCPIVEISVEEHEEHGITAIELLRANGTVVRYSSSNWWDFTTSDSVRHNLHSEIYDEVTIEGHLDQFILVELSQSGEKCVHNTPIPMDTRIDGSRMHVGVRVLVEDTPVLL